MNPIYKLKSLITKSLVQINNIISSFAKKILLNVKLKKIGRRITLNKIIIGSVFSNLGGLPHHIIAITQYSKFHPLHLPPFNLMPELKTHSEIVSFKKNIEKRLKKQNVQILHSHVDPWFLELCERTHKKGTKWVHTYHTLYFEKDWDNKLQPWQKEINKSLIQTARNADVKIAISYWLKDLLKEKYDIDTIYIPNGVDVNKCDKADANRFVETYKLKDFVLFASGISDIKNPGDFIKLAHAIPEVPFVIIGRQISIQALTDKYNTKIPKNLTVIGQMPHEELLDAIAACKIFVVTSRSEGLPTVLMEAMALERTVVGCDTFGTKEVIGSEQMGYIYDHCSIDDLVAKTKAAFINPKGEKARQRILENYDWKVVIPQIDAIYSNLLNC